MIRRVPAFVIMAFLALAVLFSCSRNSAPPIEMEGEETRLTIMSFNLLVGGVQRGEPLERCAEVIRAGRADIVALQETALSARPLAKELGYNVKSFGLDKAILSRYPIVETYDDGARIALGPGRDVVVFVTHLAPYPYGPYDLRDDPSLSEAELVATAEKARARSAGRYLEDMRPFSGGRHSSISWPAISMSPRISTGPRRPPMPVL